MEHHKASSWPNPFSGEDWFDPLEEAVRCQVRGFIEALVEAELQAALGGRGRYERKGAPKGYRNGHRDRQLVGTFGQQRVSLPRARLIDEGGGAREWHSQTIRAYKRLTKRAEALIAQVYLAGTNTRRVRRALASLFAGAVSKDTGEPGLASGAERLGGLAGQGSLARGYRAADPGRHRGQGPLGQARHPPCWWLSGFAGTVRRCFSPVAWLPRSW